MEYLYAVLLLHSAKKPITQEHLTNLVRACGVEPDEAQIELILKSLEGTNIDQIIAQATAAPIATSTVQTEAVQTKSSEPESEPEATISDEEAEHGLDALFG